MAGVRITQLAAYAALGTNEATLFAMVDPADPTMGPTGTTKRVTGDQVVGNYQGANVAWPNAIVVIGADPGGTQRLRVMGGARVSGGDLTVDGVVTGQNLIVTPGNASLAGQLTTQGLATFNAQVNAPTGPVLIGTPDPGGPSILRVAGNANVAGTLFSNGASVAGSVTATGNVQARTLNVVNGATMGDTLLVNGISTFQARVNIVQGGLVIGTDPGGTELLRVGVAAGGSARFGGNVTVGLADGNGRSITLNASAGAAAHIAFDTAGVLKWVVGRGTADGSDNFQIFNGQLGNIGLVATVAANAFSIPNGTLVVGPDPGGTELLRVGGGIRTLGNISVNSPSSAQLVLSPTGAGSSEQILFIDGGATKWQMGNNVSIGGNQFEIFNSALGQTSLAINPLNAITTSGSLAVGGNIQFGGPQLFSQFFTTLANSGTITLSGGYGLLYIMNTANGSSALFLTGAVGNPVVFQLGTLFTGDQPGHAGTINVYGGGGIVIQNMTGGSVTIRFWHFVVA